MRILSILFFVHLSFAQQSVKEYPYLNPSLTVEARVNDLVSRLTLEEKVSQMIDVADEIPRLGIPEYNWWNEALHGVARAGRATVFPQAIGLAATWNTDLMFDVADIISTEARAKHNEFLRHNEFSRYKGLTFWSPNINIFRDPRWGRGQETYGEDPYLTSRMGVAFVKGLQGNDPKYFKVIATPKHYAVHSGPEPNRHTFDAITINRDLYETYLPAFEACIKEAGAYSIMCAYNRYMGEACCGSPLLLRKILREDWGFQGYIVSDCGAIDDIYKAHKIVPTAAEAAARAVKSGTDLECGNTYTSALIDAVKKGMLTETEIDISVKRLFTARFKLGMFDPSEMVPFSKISVEEIDSEEHRALSKRAALESIILLKNTNNVLPLKKNLKRIAVIGPTADSYQMLLGNYNGTPSKYSTLLQGIKHKAGTSTEVVYEIGCNLVGEGSVVHNLTSDILCAEKDHIDADWRSGLTAEYFRNKNLKGEPYYTKIDPLDNPNWIYGTRVPSLWNEPEYSIRWKGFIIAPSTGNFVFTVKGNDGYRLSISNTILVDDWSEHTEATEESSTIHLQEGKSYPITIEYFRSKENNANRPVLTVQWEVKGYDNFKKALDVGKNSDVIIFAGGITPQLEGEEMKVDYEGFKGGDRTSLDLPKVQEKLLKLLSATEKPVILILTSGSALSVNWEKENIPGILQVWYPGQEGGRALADVLFGDYNPGGRLPVTFYKSVDQLPPFEDYNMKGRTYRYFTDEPLFPFGYGLSYTTFSYSGLKINGTPKINDTIKVEVKVKNSGTMAGDEVVQLYVSNQQTSIQVPIRSLKGFRRIHLNPGGEQNIEFIIAPDALAIHDEENNKKVIPGTYVISVGGGQPQSAGTNVVQSIISIH